MSYSEFEFARLERTGAFDYADKKPPVYPRLIDCRDCGGYHPAGREHCQEEPA